MSPERAIDGTVYPPVYGVADISLGPAKMHGELSETAPSSMVPTTSFLSGVYEIS